MQQSFTIGMIDVGLADALTALVARAAEAILAIGRSSLNPRMKADRTPVTAADEASDAVLAEGLTQLVPALSVVSEEAAERAATVALGDSFVLVDPLDGTKEFLAGRNDYTLNLAVVTHGRPVAGFIAAPALGLVFRGVVGRRAERLHLDTTGALSDPVPIACRKRLAGGLIATVSRSHLDPASDAFLDRLPVTARIACGSALKFCRIAEGTADIYPRLSATFEWDIAAGHAIIAAAGGGVTTPDGAPLTYGGAERGYVVPGFVAWGDPAGVLIP